MNLTVLGASGATGQQLTRQALERGHTVTAVARNPATFALRPSDQLIVVAADVRNPEEVADALAPGSIVLSGLGNRGGHPPLVLAAGARAVIHAQPQHIIWLGAYGTGSSSRAAGTFTTSLLRLVLRNELEDKITADQTILAAGGTVFHAGPLTDKPLSSTRRTIGLGPAPRRLFPARVSRATVAAAMLDEAEIPQHAGEVAIPLDR